jgi:hypothetical protein
MADKQTKEGALQTLRSWGGSSHHHPKLSRAGNTHPSLDNSVPPTVLATLITAQHARPFQALPMAFVPVLLFSSYLNLSGYKTDAAGTTAAWSGLYALLAMRRRQVSTYPSPL